jgi:hypothetical protein
LPLATNCCWTPKKGRLFFLYFNFPRLPVREGKNVLLGLAIFDDAASFDAFARVGAWAREVLPELSKWLHRPTENHRLVATARSAIHA